MSPRLHEGTLGDLRTLMGQPPKLRRGFTQNVIVPNPGAGSNVAYTVNADYWRRFRTLAFQFVTSATTTERELSIAFTDGNGLIYDAIPVFGTRFASATTQFYADTAYSSAQQPEQSVASYGTAAAPAAGTVIASLTVTGPGVALIDWTVEVSGTLAAGTDNDNFQLVVNGGNILESENPAVAGTYPQLPLQVEETGVITVQIKAIATATAGSTYSASMALQLPTSSLIHACIPDLILQPGWQVQINANNIQAGDQFQNIYGLCEHYASDWASGTDAAETEEFIDALLGRLADG
jgi:hypothetical protein